ncbi:MAG: hypothetical protein H8D71_02045, partial [Deltaproteobacteria bacterium]|nr:hypothetical protein [Deltaproteobacteria bacterium]
MRWIPFVLITAGCEDLLGKDPSLGYSDGEIVTEAGVAELKIKVKAGQSSFLLTADGEDYVAVDEIRDPDGNQVFYWDDWYSEPYSLTSGVWPLDNEMVLNWPIRGEEANLFAGTWKVTLAAIKGSTGAYQSGSNISYTVQTKDDPSFVAADVNVRLVYADGVDDMAGGAAAVGSAPARRGGIWEARGPDPQRRNTNNGTTSDPPHPGKRS